MPPIAYKLHSLNYLPEIALVTTAHVAQKTSVFGFGSVTAKALSLCILKSTTDIAKYILKIKSKSVTHI